MDLDGIGGPRANDIFPGPDPAKPGKLAEQLGGKEEPEKEGGG